MEKNKGLFSFRKHPIGNFLDEKKGRKRKGGRLRRSMGFLMVAALIFNTLPASGLAVSASGREVGLCEHHRSHTADCGYMEAQPCTHEHTEECYTTVTECVHEHTDECYPETEETEESAGEGSATDSGAEGREPENCTHKCSEESGCITKVLDCHHEHDESCGYKEAQDCGYVCEICNGIKSEDTENTEDTDTDTAKCICETLCTEGNGSNSGRINGDCPVCGAEGADLSACKGKEQGSAPEKDTADDNAGTDRLECICETLCTEDNINGDCPVCGAEDADLSRCVGEKTEEQEKTGEKVITAWEWVDPEEYLTDGMLALPGAGRENPVFMEDVTILLPEKIQAEVVIVNAAENGEETEKDAETVPETEDAEITLTGWECASYPKDGAYEGTYTFTAFLPEGFVLAEDAAALEVKVELGGVEMLAETVSVSYQEASWNDSEVTYTGKTETCTPVESSADAVTWNAGWYVVNGTVTITEPITVTGAVNLILADGCTLDAQKGIVVTTDNSLTIYAQTGGSGTLNATGVFFYDGDTRVSNASAGIGGSGTAPDSGAITIHGGVINATGGGQSKYCGGAGIGGGSPNSGNGGSSGAVIIYGGTITANSGAGEVTGAGIGGGGSGKQNGGAGNGITIYGGSVTAASTGTGTGGAGIGGGGGFTGGSTGSNIQICSGMVNATGGARGAGIGGGGSGSTSGDGTNITISGGTVKAIGGNYAAGIGGGGGYYYSSQYGSGGCTGGTGSVTITGGIVDASSPTEVAWEGYEGAPIGNGGNAGDTAATVNKTNAIVFENGAGTVCGDVTLDGSYNVPAGYSLHIPAGASLSGSGTLSGGSAFTTENLRADMISVPGDWHYTGEDLTEKIKSAVSLNGEITICGQTFTASTDGWELSVEKVSELGYTVKYTHTDKGTLSKTVTIARGQTALSDVVTYKEEGTTPANTFSVGETIIVKATATFPVNNAIMAAAEFDTPAGEQMAVYYNDTQISAPSTVENGVHTMTVDTSNLPESALNKEIALTVKYIESDNASGATATTNVTVTAAARVKKDSTTTYVGALADAFTEGNSGATVTLLSEVDLGSNYIGIRGSSTFTLDLNGQTVKASHYGAFHISGGSLTIQDSGTGGKIESSNITIEVTGGTLSIQSGTVSGLHGVQISSGTVNISGGTISGSDTGLWVSGGGNITLSGGTFSGVVAVQVDANASVTLKDLLAAGHAYHQNDIPVANAEGPGGEVPLDAKPAWLTGTVTVKECSHTGGLVPSENGYQHGGPCKCCNTALTAENHTLGADNQCSGCGAALAAKVEKSGSDTIYVEASGLEAAFAKNSGNDGATFTLLANVEPNTYLTIQINCILNLGGHTITGYIGSNQCVCVDKNTAVTILGEGEIIAPNGIALAVDGSVTLEGGTYTSTGSEDFSHGVQVSQSATLSVTGEKVTIRNTGGGSGLNVDDAQSVQLSAGTYSGAKAIESIVKLSDMLVHTDNTRYAYYQNDIPVTKASAWVDNNIGDVPLDTPIAWLSDTVTVKACNHAGEGVCTYTHNENTSTHTKTCLACGKTWDAEDCAYTFSGGTGTCAACGDSVTVTVSGTDGLIYDGTEKEPGVTVMRGETALTAGTDYTVAYTDNKNAGENKATVAVTIGNGQGNYIQNFTIGRAALTIKANDQTITYGVSIAAGTDQVTPAGLCTGDTLEGVTLSASSVNVPGGTITPSGAVIKRSGKDVTANYNINYMPGTLTINRAQGTLTVPAGPVAKIFGDGQFLLGCSTNGDGKISYASSDENVASVSADGNVLIKGAGEAAITVFLADGTNYIGAESQEVRITVAKAAAPTIPGETRNYTYSNGSRGTVTIDVAGKLPKDRGETTYTAAATDDKGILSGVSIDQDGNLVYTVEGNKAAVDTAVITVTAVMANYTNAVFTLKINLVDVIQVKIKAEAENAVYDGSPQKGYADGITCDYPVAGYAFAYKGREDTAYDSREPPVDAGSYTVTVSVSDQSEDYEGSVSLMFTINKASITIKADDKTAEKGSPVPELTYTASGLAEKDMLAAAPKLVCDADMKTEGSYPITVSGAKVPDAKNYYEEITYENGMLTVQDSAVHVTGVSLDKSTLSLSEGGAGQLTAVLSPENATDKSVSWASGNTAVASVDSSGKVTAVRGGTAVITVTTADGRYTASCTVTVTKDAGSGSTGGGSGSTGSGTGGGSGSTGSGTGGGSGSTGSGSTGGGSGSTGGSTDTKQPFIKDSSGREGWDVIRAEAETAAAAPAGGTVAVDMNGTVSVPGSIFAAVRGKDVTLSFDMGSGVTWSVNGKDVTAEAAGDTDFSVTADAGAIPEELLARTAGGLAHLEISLAHEGAFGFTATLTLRITGRDGNGTATGSSGTAAEYTGMYANLFYYNPDLRSLEFVCAGQIREDGTADLPFVHASDYTVILSAAPMGGTGTPEEPEKPQEPAAEAKVKSVKLSKTLYTYDGKLKKPAVLAVDTEGRRISARYYTVSYKNNRKAGRATATVKFKGGYSGTVKKTFTIRPAGTSIQKLTAVSGGFTVKWKKKTVQTGGYQIQYSANAGFQGSSTHSVFVKKNTAVKKTVKNLKAGKKYYVRIRTYQTVKEDGKNIRIYSAWSRAARVNTLPVSRKKTASSGRDRAFLMVEKEDGKKRAA